MFDSMLVLLGLISVLGEGQGQRKTNNGNFCCFFHWPIFTNAADIRWSN